MRKATLIGMLIATMLVFGLMLVPVVGANGNTAPLLQATATPTGEATVVSTEVATEVATVVSTEVATEVATVVSTEVATAVTTTTPAATTAPGTLPNTGGDSGMGLILLGAAVLLIMGASVAILMANRRGV